jgi:DNA modification methylase
MKTKTKLLLGDAKEQLSSLPSNSVDLIFTSPPYAERRKGTYGGISQYEYVDWFMPFACH